jgi:hypothetical protein
MLKVREERRIFERFPARFPVRFRHLPQDFGTNVFLRDASAQGVHITSRCRLYIHDSISLEIKLPDDSLPLVLNAQVVWIRPKYPTVWDVGLEFHKIDLMLIQRMYRFVTPSF